MKVDLTKGEINHILDLIHRNENDEVYYRPKGQYWARSARIKSKLNKSKNRR